MFFFLFCENFFLYIYIFFFKKKKGINQLQNRINGIELKSDVAPLLPLNVSSTAPLTSARATSSSPRRKMRSDRAYRLKPTTTVVVRGRRRDSVPTGVNDNGSAVVKKKRKKRSPKKKKVPVVASTSIHIPAAISDIVIDNNNCLLYTSPSPRD